ncbi:MAG: aminodeoxychorismate/anthranilate synthase component II [Planctomycetota bacterium]
MGYNTRLITVVDNRDSFTFNLVQELQALGAEVRVRAARSVDPEEALSCDGVLIGPGPGRPEHAGSSEAIVRRAASDQGAPPVLGVCLGHQAIATALGGRVRRATELVHGQTRPIEHDGSGVLTGLDSPFEMARYNSLVVDEEALPAELAVTARGADGDIAGLRHRSRPVFGLQGHPESILCVAGGRAVLSAFVALCNATDRVR